MPQVTTLIDDIESMLGAVADGSKSTEVTPEQTEQVAALISKAVTRQLTVRPKGRIGTPYEKKLFMSELGKPCRRQLWYNYHTPEKAEPMQPHTLVKFLIGDITEAVMLLLARLAGHEVEAEQERVEIPLRNGWMVSGRKDAHIDGALVDVKSASKYSFEKFKKGLDDSNDAFGYRTQLDSYALADEVSGTPVKEAGFLVMNKETGKMMYAPHEVMTSGLREHANLVTEELEQPTPPDRAFEAVPEGKSGNMKLDTNCSYCAFKHECWPGLRGFLYAKGPVWLTEVKKTPDVNEIPKGVASAEDTAA